MVRTKWCGPNGIGLRTKMVLEKISLQNSKEPTDKMVAF